MTTILDLLTTKLWFYQMIKQWAKLYWVWPSLAPTCLYSYQSCLIFQMLVSQNLDIDWGQVFHLLYQVVDDRISCTQCYVFFNNSFFDCFAMQKRKARMQCIFSLQKSQKCHLLFTFLTFLSIHLNGLT